MRSSVIVALVAVVVVPACVGTDAERQQQAENVEECSGGASDEEVADTIRMTEEYARSLESSLTITWLPILFAIDFGILFGETILRAVTGTPIGWTFDDGVYTYEGSTGIVEMEVRTSEDSSYGPAGTTVSENIFALDSYLVGGASEHDEETDVVTITFDGPGPLVELLGLGATPASPITLTAEERQDVIASVASLALAPDYTAVGFTQLLRWEFLWRAQPETIAAMAGGELPIDVELIAVDASRADTGQTLTTNVWDVEQNAGTVSGRTTFDVSGGAFPYGGEIAFNTPTPYAVVVATRELDCQ